MTRLRAVLGCWERVGKSTESSTAWEEQERFPSLPGARSVRPSGCGPKLWGECEATPEFSGMAFQALVLARARPSKALIFTLDKKALS